MSTAVEPLSKHIVAAVRALQTEKRRHFGTFQPLLVCFFQLVFVQGNAVQQITLILGGCIVIDAEPFADCTELVKHFNSSRGHSFDLDIHRIFSTSKCSGCSYSFVNPFLRCWFRFVTFILSAKNISTCFVLGKNIPNAMIVVVSASTTDRMALFKNMFPIIFSIVYPSMTSSGIVSILSKQRNLREPCHFFRIDVPNASLISQIVFTKASIQYIYDFSE